MQFLWAVKKVHFYYTLTSGGKSCNLTVETHFWVCPYFQPLFATKSSDFQEVQCFVIVKTKVVSWSEKIRDMKVTKNWAKIKDICGNHSEWRKPHCTKWTGLKDAMVWVSGKWWMKFLLVVATGSRATGRAPHCGWSRKQKAGWVWGTCRQGTKRRFCIMKLRTRKNWELIISEEVRFCLPW